MEEQIRTGLFFSDDLMHAGPGRHSFSHLPSFLVIFQPSVFPVLFLVGFSFLLLSSASTGSTLASKDLQSCTGDYFVFFWSI